MGNVREKILMGLGTFSYTHLDVYKRQVSYSAAMNLHLKMLSGQNSHHMAEAMFKAFAKALDMATGYDERIDGVLSTKDVYKRQIPERSPAFMTTSLPAMNPLLRSRIWYFAETT